MTKEKCWHEMIARYTEKHGPVAGENRHPIQHHHVVGRKGKARHPVTHESLLIGPWFVIPLPMYLHQGTEDPCSIAVSRREFVKKYGKESALWWNMCRTIMAEQGDLPFGSEIAETIQAQ